MWRHHHCLTLVVRRARALSEVHICAACCRCGQLWFRHRSQFHLLCFMLFSPVYPTFFSANESSVCFFRMADVNEERISHLSGRYESTFYASWMLTHKYTSGQGGQHTMWQNICPICYISRKKTGFSSFLWVYHPVSATSLSCSLWLLSCDSVPSQIYLFPKHCFQKM